MVLCPIVAGVSKLFEEIQTKALSLPPEERERLAAELIYSLDDAPLNEIDAAWIEEAERRYEEWRSGKAEMIPGDQFFSDLRRELGCD